MPNLQNVIHSASPVDRSHIDVVFGLRRGELRHDELPRASVDTTGRAAPAADFLHRLVDGRSQMTLGELADRGPCGLERLQQLCLQAEGTVVVSGDRNCP